MPGKLKSELLRCKVYVETDSGRFIHRFVVCFINWEIYLSVKSKAIGMSIMKRELGIARCGLACCLCNENEHCAGCNSEECPDKDRCENKKCSAEKKYEHCYECKSECRKGLLSKIKPYGFTLFIKRYGETELLDCLERNEKAGVIYHRQGLNGDYDDFNDVEELIHFIKTGEK